MAEVCATVLRSEMTKQGVIGTGLFEINLSEIDQHSFGFVPRSFSTSKTPDATAFGNLMPMIIAYMQIVDADGKILCYRRKSKNNSLDHRYSIGIGGHASMELVSLIEEMGSGVTFHNLLEQSAIAELAEEAGLERFEVFTTDDNLVLQVMSPETDPTGSVHLGFPVEIQLGKDDLLNCDPAEVIEPTFYTVEELKQQLADGKNFEPWSKMIIEKM